MNFEQPKQTSSAESRRQRAEAEGKLSISHWKGELHSHSSTDLENPDTPEQVLENRKGSNCGKIPLEVLAKYHAQELRNQFLANTEHSRDADTEQAISGATDWFTNMYLENEGWLQEKFSKSKGKLSKSELETIKSLAYEKAKQLALYGDERLEQIQGDIEGLKEKGELPITMIKGVEANLLPDGSYDTEMIEAGDFELVNCSIHPNLDREGYAEIVSDPNKYTELAIKGIENPKTNIMCHIGQDIDPEVTAKLDWDAIAKAAAENQVAIEINLRSFVKFLYSEIFDYEKYPANDRSYVDALKAKLDELIPIISSPEIAEQIKPYFEKGLKIAINTDEHENIFVDSSTDEEGTTAQFKERGTRYWRAMKIVEEYFNNKFGELGIGSQQIINTYSPEKLQKFLAKS